VSTIGKPETVGKPEKGIDSETAKNPAITWQRSLEH